MDPTQPQSGEPTAGAGAPAGPSTNAPTPDLPTAPTPGARGRSTPLPQLLTELRDLVVTYLRQQTITPLKKLGRYIGFGLAGSVLLGLGSVMLGLGVLRLLQEETGDTFTGDWSFAPYLITVVVLAIGAGGVWLARLESKETQR
jgi:hypothetical protein